MAMVAALPLLVGSAALGAYGQIRSAQAQAAASRYNQQVNNNNAIAAEQQAQSQAYINSRRAYMQQGEQLASYSASGVVTSEGSPLDVMAQSASAAELDRQNITYGGQAKAQSFRSQAQLDGMQAKTAMQNGYLSAAGTLLQAGSSMYSSGVGSSLRAS